MRIKNTLPVKWMVGVIIVLSLVAHKTYRTSHNMSLHGGTNASSSQHENFFQFLADMLGFGPDTSSNPNNKSSNNNSNQNDQGSGHMGAGGTQQQVLNPGAADNGGPEGGPGGAANMQQGSGTAGMNAGINPEAAAEKGDSDLSTEDNPEFNAEMNAEINAEDNNPENNSGNNSEINSNNGSGNNSGTNPTNNPAGNSETNSENNSGNNPGDNSNSSGSGSSGNPGNGSGNNSGNNPGNDPGNDSGNSLWTNPSNLPTINPIPSDGTVSQSIAQQNQQNNSMAALISQRQALVAPVVQQAQASKYQTVDTQNLPAPSTNQPPPDVEAKVLAKQLTYH